MSKGQEIYITRLEKYNVTQVGKDYISKLTGWRIPMLVSSGDLYSSGFDQSKVSNISKFGRFTLVSLFSSKNLKIVSLGGLYQ